MVQAIENLTALEGAILSRRPAPGRPDWDLVDLQVDAAAPVEGRADMLGRHRGEALTVAVRSELLADAATGQRLALRAKWTPDGAMAEPHPEGDAFRRLG